MGSTIARMGFLVRKDFFDAGQFQESPVDGIVWSSIDNKVPSGIGTAADPEMTGECLTIPLQFWFMVDEKLISFLNDAWNDS